MNKNKKSFPKNISNILLVALILVLIILTFGWFVKEKKKEFEEDTNLLKSRIKKVQQRILELKIIRAKLEQRKRLRFLFVRIIIGVIFIVLDFFFLFHTVKTFDLVSVLNNILTINGIVLMIYSFVAFITYGTITNFISALKQKSVYILEKKHIDSIEELNSLEQELEVLKMKLMKKETDLKNIKMEVRQELFEASDQGQ